MELKNNETEQKQSGYFYVENNQQNPNDILFKRLDDEPFAEAGYYVNKLKPVRKKTPTAIVIAVAVVLTILALGLYWSIYKSIYKYDGKYELTRISTMEGSMTVEEIEATQGRTIQATLKITGEVAYIDFSVDGVKRSGYSEFKFKDDMILLTDSSGTIQGYYYEDKGTIVLLIGTDRLTFEKVK